MPRGVHKNPFLGWNPPAGDSAWVRSEAERCGVALSALLNEALSDLRAKRTAKHPAAPVLAAEVEQPQQCGEECKHPKKDRLKGRCTRCRTFVGFT